MNEQERKLIELTVESEVVKMTRHLSEQLSSQFVTVAEAEKTLGQLLVRNQKIMSDLNLKLQKTESDLSEKLHTLKTEIQKMISSSEQTVTAGIAEIDSRIVRLEKERITPLEEWRNKMTGIFLVIAAVCGFIASVIGAFIKSLFSFPTAKGL